MVSPRRVDAELQASIPTPVLISNLARPDVGPGRLFVKNDGLSGQTYGGNKTRKLAPVFRALRKRDVRRVLTTGTAGSHHVLAMGLFGPAEGIQVSAVLLPQVHSLHTERILRIISTLEIDLLPCDDTWGGLRHAVRMLDSHAAWVGPGALGPTSTRGYVDAFNEWRLQRAELNVDQCSFEHHVVAAGSGGTAAGLLAGLCASRQKGRVVAVAVNRNPSLRALVVGQALAVSSRDRMRDISNPDRLCVTAETLGGGYGHSSPCTQAAIEQAAKLGLTLEHTYTAKAFAVATRLTRTHPEDIVVFWQTLSQLPLDPWLAHAPPLSHLAPALRRLVVPA